jgi:uncharacterized membrane protein
MFDGPLHPMVVHFPIVLAFLAPFAGVAAFWAIRRRHVGAGAWLGVVLLQVALVVSTFAAVRAGERDEERVESVVGERQLERHEEWGERFLWASGLALLLSGTGLVWRSSDAPKTLSILASAGVVAVAIWTGHSGGELVYRYNAGAAHASAWPSSTTRTHDDR